MALARGLGSFGPRLAGPIALRPVVRITADKRSEKKKMCPRLVVDRKQEVGRAMGEVLPAGRYCGLHVTYMWPLARSERTTLASVIVTMPCRLGLQQQNESRDSSIAP